MTKVLDNSQVYTAGRVYVGVGGSFIKFPRNLQYVEFSPASGMPIDVWSKDGQSIFIECSFYYALSADHIFDVFKTFGPNYNAIITGIATETLRTIATSYETEEFFTNRSSIDAAMSAQLDA